MIPRSPYGRWIGLLGLAVVLTLAVTLPPLDGILETHEGLHHLQHALVFLFSLAAGRGAYGLVRAATVHGRGGTQRLARTLLSAQRHYNPGGIPALLFAAVLAALWHIPALFNLAVQDDLVHVLEHLSFVLAGGAVGGSLPQMSRWVRWGALLGFALASILLSAFIVVFGVHVYTVYPYDHEWAFAIGMIYAMMPIMVYGVYRFLVAQVS